jgi:hypothetical protein
MKNYTNIKAVVLGLILCSNINLQAQVTNSTVDPVFEMGQGLQFKFNNGDYQVKIGGMIQPQIGFRKDSTADAKYYLNSKRSFFNVSGKAAKEKITFLFQTDFSLANPLLDGWVCYKPNKYLGFTVGQQLAFSNNREMAIMETQFQFIDRSLLSTQFSSTGREFGLFIESNFNLGKVLIAPKASITSGDGRNSFGTGSTDYDLGGVKYGGRIDVYPFGNFTAGNEQLIADIKHEPTPKLVLGAAGSYNSGASHFNGEGHGDFLLYDGSGKNKLPDYRKLYYDVLFKFKGFSLLAEYVIATGKVREGTFYDVPGLNRVKTTEISELLALGSGFNAQAGYVLHKKYGIDFRYATISREFTSNANSIIKDQHEVTYGLTKYVHENNLKINASVTHLNVGSASSLLGTLYVQLIF